MTVYNGIVKILVAFLATVIAIRIDPGPLTTIWLLFAFLWLVLGAVEIANALLPGRPRDEKR